MSSSNGNKNTETFSGKLKYIIFLYIKIRFQIILNLDLHVLQIVLVLDLHVLQIVLKILHLCQVHCNDMILWLYLLFFFRTLKHMKNRLTDQCQGFHTIKESTYILYYQRKYMYTFIIFVDKFLLISAFLKVLLLVLS